MWMMLQSTEPKDYVVATGEMHSIKDFLDIAFGYVDLDWNKFVEVDPKFYRPADVHILQGDSSKARADLGWEPEVGFQELVHRMVANDLDELELVQPKKEM